MIAIATDVTSIKEFDKHGKKLRSMFFSSVAHELWTPLNSIIPIVKMVIANVDRFSPGMQDAEKQRLLKYLKIILNSALHLESVIEDALDISRLENNKFQIFEDVFSLSDAVEEVSQIMRFQISEKGLQLITEIGPRVPSRVFNDQKRYKQILFNLVGNAVKFTYQGFIKIKLDVHESGELSTSVTDTGLGIHEEDLNKLFQFFGKIAKSSEVNRGGMGLGLTISKMIVQQLGGHISVESVPNVGSTFSFRLPFKPLPLDLQNQVTLSGGIHESLGETDTYITNHDMLEVVNQDLDHKINRLLGITLAGKNGPREERKHQKLVMIVDDSPYNLFVMQELVAQVSPSIKIDTALNGQLAINQVNSLPLAERAYDVIFLDIHMPILDGYQVSLTTADFDKTATALRRMEQEGTINLSSTLVIALSAICENQFINQEVDGKMIFDMFSKHIIS